MFVRYIHTFIFMTNFTLRTFLHICQISCCEHSDTCQFHAANILTHMLSVYTHMNSVYDTPTNLVTSQSAYTHMLSVYKWVTISSTRGIMYIYILAHQCKCTEDVKQHTYIFVLLSYLHIRSVTHSHVTENITLRTYINTYYSCINVYTHLYYFCIILFLYQRLYTCV
jgi:hypothetical protein